MKFPRCPHCDAYIDPATVVDGMCRTCHKPVPFGSRATAIPDPAYPAPNLKVKPISIAKRAQVAALGGRASRTSRLAARMVDWFLLVMSFGPGWFLLTKMDLKFPDDIILIEVGFLLFYLLPFALEFYQFMLLWLKGQTIGKEVLGIRIVSYRSGRRPRFFDGIVLRLIVPGIIAAFVMAGLSFVSIYVAVWFPLIDLVFIFGKQRRCLHDLIAGTIVVEA